MMASYYRVQRVLISPEKRLQEAIQLLDSGGMGVLLVVDKTGKLLGILTDGDVRRAILRGGDLDKPVGTVSNCDPLVHYGPISASEALPLMNKGRRFLVNHLPILDNQGRPVDLILRSDLNPDDFLPLTAVVMAGGLGKRLRPLTEELPKSMLPVGGRPLLEKIIEQLHQAGIHRVNLATHYKAEMISQHFGDGRNFDVEITYVREDEPLGTAGALSLIKESDEPLLVINGDILTKVDFRAMLDFHRESSANMTVAVRQYEFRIPYGVIEIEGDSVKGISEKPVIRHFINAGIYLLNPEVCRLIPNRQSYCMPDLIGRLIAEGKRVVGFPIREYWLDIGHPEDYEKALADKKTGKV